MINNGDFEPDFCDDDVSTEEEAHDLSKTEIKYLLYIMNNAYDILKNDKNVTKTILNSIVKVKKYKKQDSSSGLVGI